MFKRNSLKLFNIFFGLALGIWLANCSGGMLAPANKATDDGSVSAGGGALDEIGINVAGNGNMAPGPGGPPGAGGSMTGGGGPEDPLGGGGSGGGTAGGGGGPFDDVGAGGGGATAGSGTECSGGHCTTDSPSGVLLARFPISVSLFYDPDTQGGNCNDLWPPPTTFNNCQLQYKSSQSTPLLESLLLGRAWALPTQNFPAGGGDAPTICETKTIQPPIDPNLIPKVEIKSRESLYPIQINMYDQTHSATCSSNGRWTVTTPLIEVNLSSPSKPYYWHFDITAFYPANGVWQPRGTQTLQMKCEMGGATAQGQEIVCTGQVLPPAKPGITTPLSNVEAVAQ